MTDTLTQATSSLTSLDVVIPVYNEDQDLEASVRSLRRHLDKSVPFGSTVTIADNASTDSTWAVARLLAAEIKGVRVLHLDKKGRGRALRAAWTTSEADIVAYMDVDLSTDLGALLPLVAAVASGHSDLAIGSRLARGAHVVRGPKREVISRCYNLFLRSVLRNRFTDAQCGFKAISAIDARALLPAVEDEEWFFDTELLVLAERNGLRIHEVPVDWKDDPDSRVQIGQTVAADFRGVLRLVRTFAAGGGRVEDLEGRRRSDSGGEMGRFISVGPLSTVVYLVLFLVLRTEMNDYVANVVSLGLCSVANIALQRAHGLRQERPPTPLRTRRRSDYFHSVCQSWRRPFVSRVALSLDPRSLIAGIAALFFGSVVAGFGRFFTFRALVFHAELCHRSS